VKDNNIGKVWCYEDDATLSILDWDGTTTGNVKKVKKYIVECSICSRDTVLWPYGSIMSTINRLNSNVKPCGCSKIPKWKEFQYKVRVKRDCEVKGYIFHGWASDYKGNKTYLDLENPSSGNRWKTTTISDLFCGGGDPVAARARINEAACKPDIELISIFKSSGSYVEGTKFYRNTDKKGTDGWQGFWDYTCPVCSNDEYAEKGLCSGIFTSATSCLRSGYKSCRCSVGYRWTKAQREYQIKKILNLSGGIFSGWIGDYKSSATEFKYTCEHDLVHKTSVNSFVNGHHDNWKCCSGGGYKREKSGLLYLVAWRDSDRNPVLVKFGITNDTVKSRIRRQKLKTSLSPKVLHTFTHDDGGLIADIESELKQIYKGYLTVPKDLLPDGYTEAFFYNEKILAEIKDYVENRLNHCSVVQLLE
jgi:hypothetical protein